MASLEFGPPMSSGLVLNDRETAAELNCPPSHLHPTACTGHIRQTTWVVEEEEEEEEAVEVVSNFGTARTRSFWPFQLRSQKADLFLGR